MVLCQCGQRYRANVFWWYCVMVLANGIVLMWTIVLNWWYCVMVLANGIVLMWTIVLYWWYCVMVLWYGIVLMWTMVLYWWCSVMVLWYGIVLMWTYWYCTDRIVFCYWPMVLWSCEQWCRRLRSDYQYCWPGPTVDHLCLHKYHWWRWWRWLWRWKWWRWQSWGWWWDCITT